MMEEKEKIFKERSESNLSEVNKAMKKLDKKGVGKKKRVRESKEDEILER